MTRFNGRSATCRPQRNWTVATDTRDHYKLYLWYHSRKLSHSGCLSLLMFGKFPLLGTTFPSPLSSRKYVVASLYYWEHFSLIICQPAIMQHLLSMRCKQEGIIIVWGGYYFDNACRKLRPRQNKGARMTGMHHDWKKYHNNCAFANLCSLKIKSKVVSYSVRYSRWFSTKGKM